MAANQPTDGPEVVLPNSQHPVVTWDNGVCRATPVPTQIGVLPGAFNPLHDGHRNLREAASVFLNRPVVFELSVANVDKPRLTPAMVRQRLQQFANDTVVLTDAPLFAHKARLFAGCWFVVGMDTAVRLLEPRYYGNSVDQRDNALHLFQSRNIRFLVAGRLLNEDDATSYKGRDQLVVNEASRHLFVELPERLFRMDISSTALRNQSGSDVSPDR